MFEDIMEQNEMSVEEIRNKLLECDNSYYNDSDPIISDEEYDNLKDLLKKVSPNDKYLFQVGGSKFKETIEWKKEKHKIPMGSLNKVNTIEEFLDWNKKYNDEKTKLLLSCKLDGISIDLEYENGQLIKAITRGDSVYGEDIFSNVIQMKNVMKTLKNFSGSLRGEIVIDKESFELLNKESLKNGDREYKNLRNSASGISKNFSGKYAKFLTVLYYDVTGNFQTEIQKFDWFSEKGLLTTWFKLCNSDEIVSEYKEWEKSERELYPFEIDGLCIYVNYVKKSESLGVVYNNPAGKVAFKFGNQKKETILIGVTWQMGKNRRITPVANFKPTPLGGVTIENASLHNIDIFRDLNLGMNDNVIISRKNDVIPNLDNVINHIGEKFQYPKTCPTCNHETEINGAYLECPNDNCEALFLGNLEKWIEKLEIMDFSFSSIEKLYQNNFIKTPNDFYILTTEQFSSIEGLGAKSAKSFLNQLHEKKNLDLQVFIGALNIGNFSTSICEKLINAGYNTLEKLYELNVEKLCKIQGIKEKIANKIMNGLVSKAEIIEKLLDVGIKIKSPQETIGIEMKSGKFNGKSFVFTGGINKEDPNTGKSYVRAELQKMVSENGGVNHSSITRGTTYLVQANPSSQSSKTKKAISYGVEILSETEFFKMLGVE